MASSSEPPSSEPKKIFDKPVSELLTDFWAKVVVGLAATLVIALVSGGAAYFLRDRQYEKQLENAPGVYVEQLDSLIQRAVQEGPQDARVNARAIVAARNSLAGSLESVAASLDGEINHLATQIAQPTVSDRILKEPLIGRGSDTGPRPPPPASDQEVYDTIRVLQRVWPSKRRQIEIQVRKLLAELGLSPSLVGRRSRPDR